MKFRIRYTTLYVLIVFSLLSSQKLSCQNFEETLFFADNQFKTGDFASAIKTYQRALFFSNGRSVPYLFRQIAEISYIQKDYETAQKYFGLAYSQADNDSLRTELLFQKASCQMLNKNYQFAIIDLLSINDSSRAARKRLNFYLATCYFGLEDFQNARNCFDSCINGTHRKELSELFSDKNLLSPSPKKARIMSMIIPGLGQTYSGDFKSGLNSLVLTSGLIALGIKLSVRYTPIDALITIMPWYQRYYMGGYGRAEEIARHKRQIKRNEIYAKAVKLVSENSD
jgi:tetratricopeptide (TPR) repeat protein